MSAHAPHRPGLTATALASILAALLAQPLAAQAQTPAAAATPASPTSQDAWRRCAALADNQARLGANETVAQ